MTTSTRTFGQGTRHPRDRPSQSIWFMYWLFREGSIFGHILTYHHLCPSKSVSRTLYHNRLTWMPFLQTLPYMHQGSYVLSCIYACDKPYVLNTLYSCRIIVNHLPRFKHQKVCWYIENEFATEMSQKSTIVSEPNM